MPSRTGLVQTLTGTLKNAGLKKMKFDNVRELIKFEDLLDGTGQLKIFALKAGKIQSFSKEDIWILDASGWKSRIKSKYQHNKNLKIEYLLPSPGSIDQIPTARAKKNSTAPLGVIQ